jgi:PAS domain S-box-containing protein
VAAEKDPSMTRAVVWIVDDLRSEVASLTRLLSADFTLEIFETGPQMLERLKSTPPPDVLVIEQWLRGPTGVELCRALRASLATAGLPILLLTVPVDDDEILQGLEAGADDYLIKPFSPRLLAARIVSLIRVKRLRERAERAEAEARNERDRFEALIEQSGDGIIAVDEHATLRVCNQKARRQWDIARDDASLEGGVSRFELLTLEGGPIPLDDLPLQRAVRGERIEEGRWQVRRPDGSVRVLAGNASPLRHADGSPAGAVLTTRDETERLRIEEELHRSQGWLARTLESVGDALIATDDAGCVVFMNPVAIQLTGWTSDDARGRPLEDIFDIVNETTRAPVENPVAKALREGRIVGLANHTVLRSKDGSEVAIDDSAAPIRNDQGRIFGVVLVFRDVSEARRKDAELRTFRALVDASPDFIAFGSLDGRPAYLNPAAMQLVGLESQEALRGTSIPDYLSPETRDATTSAILAATAAGQPFHGVSELRHFGTGEAIPISLSTFTVNNADGRPLLLATICRDRRDQVRAEAERERLLAEAQAARREADVQREHLTIAFAQAPMAVGILRGDDDIVVLANDDVCRVWGFPRAALIGRPLFDLLVDAKKQGFPELLAQVRRTGEAFVGREVSASLPRLDGGGVETVRLNFVYQPLRAADGSMADILVMATDVTLEVEARNRAEKLAAELRESESKLYDLFMHSPVSISIREGPEHTYTLANPAYLALVGGVDIVGKPFLTALPALAGQGYEALLDRVKATGEPFYQNEAVVKLAHHAPGESLIVNFVYTPMRDAEGSIAGVLMSGVDVTEQVQARERAEALAAKLRESEERVRRVVEASGAGLWDLDVATGAIGADTRMLDLMGLPPGSTMSLESALDNIHAEERAQVAAAVAAALAGENEGRYLVEFRSEETSSGPRRWVESRAQVLFDAEGKATHLAGAMIDISARKQAEIARQSLLKEVLRSEASFRTLAEAIPQQVWTSRPDGGLDFVNERVLAYFASAKEHVLEAGWQRVIHPDDLPGVNERWSHSLMTGDEYEIEFRLKRADDMYRWHLGRAVVVRDARGEIVKWFGTNTDIHEAKQIREELEARTQFEQHLLGIVSHDLRNPLGAILLGATGLLEMEESEWVTSIAQRIHSSAERSTRMISDLLDFTQARLGGGIRLTRRALDLHALTTTTIREVVVAYPERSVELTQAGDTLGTWDSDRLAQVIANLVTNALKYSPAGTPVKVIAADRQGTVELTVHNEGAPIPAERLPRIFEPLQRATDKIDMKTRSVGLGLYIVEAIVKAHGGTVGVVSTTEAATTFTVRLPRHLEDAPSRGA